MSEISNVPYEDNLATACPFEEDSQEYERIEEAHAEEASSLEPQSNVQIEETIQETAKEAIDQVVTTHGQRRYLPPVKLVKVSIDTIKFHDPELVKKHMHNGKSVKKIRWDVERNVVVIKKSGRYRAYQIGAGKAPALAENANKDSVINFLSRMI